MKDDDKTDDRTITEGDVDVIEDAVPVEHPDSAEDLTPDVPALDLDDIEQFDQEVEQHDEVGEEGTDGDESEAAPEPEAKTDAPVKRTRKKEEEAS